MFVYVCIMFAPVLQYYYKYLCNFITKLHNATNWASSDSYISCCSVLTCYSNVNWSDSTLTVCPQLPVSFCTARRNYKAAQYAINRQLNCTWRNTRHQQSSSLNSVWFVSVRSGTATVQLAASPAVQPVVLSAALYINCTVPPCSAVPHYIYNIATLYTRRRVNSLWKYLTAWLSALGQFSKFPACSQYYCWGFFGDITPCGWVKTTKLHGTQNLWMCKTIARNNVLYV
jgi:hypothetical protein